MVEKRAIDVDRINDIARHSVQYFDGKTISLLTGTAARNIVGEIKKKLPKVKASNEVIGECAYPGRVRGTVKIVNEPSEMVKFKRGDILISNATDPSLLPIMKKAAAFVTNMGGLTCHAAIVARELEIPCVIGTKVATQVFADGQRVEVDAINGKVRRIK